MICPECRVESTVYVRKNPSHGYYHYGCYECDKTWVLSLAISEKNMQGYLKHGNYIIAQQSVQSYLFVSSSRKAMLGHVWEVTEP